MQAPGHHNMQWDFRLPPDHRMQLLAVREAYQSGELIGWTSRAIFERAKEEGIDIGVGLNTFRHWLGNDTKAKEDG